MDILNVEADDSPDESRDRRRLNYYHSPTADSEATHSENVAEFPAADEADPSPASLSQVSPYLSHFLRQKITSRPVATVFNHDTVS